MADDELERILVYYTSTTAYHAAKYAGDRAWFEHSTPEIYYHKDCCMDGNRRRWKTSPQPRFYRLVVWRWLLLRSISYIVPQPSTYHNRYNDQVLDASLALPLSHRQREKPKPRPNIGRWAGKCDECKADCFENHLGDVVCSKCGLIQEEPPIGYSNGKLDVANSHEMDCDPEWHYPKGWQCGYPCLINFWSIPEGNGRDRGQILDNPIKYDNGAPDEEGRGEGPKDRDKGIGILPGYGLKKPTEKQSFKGEADLTTPGRGTAATTRGDKQIRHFCRRHGSYLARPIWWTNPKNGNGKYWFCLKCQKAAGVVDFPPKWIDEDLTILAALGYGPDYAHGHYSMISRYLKSQREKSEKQIDPNTKNSLYHYQKVLESDRYLKTAVLTLLWIRAAGKYARLAAATTRPKPKGGRRPNGGAKAVSNWCIRCGFTKEIPIEDHRADKNNLQYGLILESFDYQVIELILKELDERNIKYCFRHLKSIADIGV